MFALPALFLCLDIICTTLSCESNLYRLHGLYHRTDTSGAACGAPALTFIPGHPVYLFVFVLSRLCIFASWLDSSFDLHMPMVHQSEVRNVQTVWLASWLDNSLVAKQASAIFIIRSTIMNYSPKEPVTNKSMFYENTLPVDFNIAFLSGFVWEK